MLFVDGYVMLLWVVGDWFWLIFVGCVVCCWVF